MSKLSAEADTAVMEPKQKKPKPLAWQVHRDGRLQRRGKSANAAGAQVIR